MADRTEAAAVVEYTQAPPATVRLHRLQFQMPTTCRFIASWKRRGEMVQNGHRKGYLKDLTFPQKVQVYLECCVISIFLTILRREAPYRVPYFPTIPTFFVRLA